MWVCSHCAMIEGALQFKPHWQEHVDIRRIDFANPREQVIELLGEDNQWLPVLFIGKIANSTGKLIAWLCW